METMNFADWALMILMSGSVAAVFGGLIGWFIFERHDD